LLDIMFELPSMDNVKKVVVEANVITEGARPILIYAEADDQGRKRASVSP
jgi:ATP-dependent Clp protease ATP-binding subunit ClpX